MTSPKSASSISTQRSVVHLFDLYNRKYFGGTLPRYKIRLRRWRISSGIVGMCDRERRTIYLRPCLPRRIVRAVMIHEMTHIRQIGHSARFYSILLDLAAAGCGAARLAAEGESTCTRKEVDDYVRRHMAMFPRGEVIRRKRS